MHNVIGVSIFLFLVYCQSSPDIEMQKFVDGIIVVFMLIVIGTIAKRL